MPEDFPNNLKDIEGIGQINHSSKQDNSLALCIRKKRKEVEKDKRRKERRKESKKRKKKKEEERKEKEEEERKERQEKKKSSTYKNKQESMPGFLIQEHDGLKKQAIKKPSFKTIAFSELAVYPIHKLQVDLEAYSLSENRKWMSTGKNLHETYIYKKRGQMGQSCNLLFSKL